MAENPYAWDYDYKKHYFEAFEKFEKEGDGNDSIGRFLAYKSTGDAFSTEPECIGSSKDVLSDALSLPDSDGDAWEKARGEDKLEKGSMSLLIGYDAMNSFATTFNCSLHVLYPDDFNDYRIKSGGRVWRFSRNMRSGPLERKGRTIYGSSWSGLRSSPIRSATSPLSRT